MHLKNVLTTKEQKACASVGTKMSLFEEKMKQEREARQKEIDIENRLKKKTPRQLVCEQDDDVMMMDAPPKPPRDEQNIKEVAFALTSDKKAKLPTPKKRATVESAPKSPEKVSMHLQLLLKRPLRISLEVSIRRNLLIVLKIPQFQRKTRLTFLAF